MVSVGFWQPALGQQAPSTTKRFRSASRRHKRRRLERQCGPTVSESCRRLPNLIHPIPRHNLACLGHSGAGKLLFRPNRPASVSFKIIKHWSLRRPEGQRVLSRYNRANV